MRMKKPRRLLPPLMTALLLILALLPGCKPGGEITRLKIWHYYGATQKSQFERQVADYNATRGREKRIKVTAENKGDVNQVADAVLAAVAHASGAEQVPNMCFLYPEAALKLDNNNLLLDLEGYFTQKELCAYVDSFLEEGRFAGREGLKIFPVAKSTEVLMLNKTDWEAFKADYPELKLSDEMLLTVEGLISVAEAYYERTGKAFYARDATANYMLAGAKQLGAEIVGSGSGGEVVLNFSKATARRLWDGYYIPAVQGWFFPVSGSRGDYATDNIGNGNIIAGTVSSAGADYFPDKVVNLDGSREIEPLALPAPVFDTEAGDCAVQQGAGVSVLKATAAEESACIDFLKWLSCDDCGLNFGTATGYIPVTKTATDPDRFRELVADGKYSATPAVYAAMEVAMETLRDKEMFWSKPFEMAKEARDFMEKGNGAAEESNKIYSLRDLAIRDAARLPKSGAEREELLAEFTSDAYFEEWYEKFYEELQTYTDPELRGTRAEGQAD